MPLPLLLVEATALCQSEPPLPVWARGAVVTAIREGLLGETQYGLYPYPTRGVHDRLGLALLFNQSGRKQTERAEAAAKGFGASVPSRASLLRCGGLLSACEWSNAVLRETFGGEFDGRVDVARLNRLMQGVSASSSSRDRLFRDVPAEHWAAKAVGDLRALGLLDGYPGGRYRS